MEREHAGNARRNILGRLRKVEGQIRGIHAMVEERKECEDILTQVKAAQAALAAVSTLIVKCSIRQCLDKACAGLDQDSAARLDKLSDALARLARMGPVDQVDQID